MADEEKQESNEGVKTEVDESKTSIDRAELDKLKQKAADFEELEHIAKAADFDTPKAHLENLENENWDKLDTAVTNEEKKIEAEKKTEGKPTTGISDEKVQQMQQSNNNAILASHWTDFRIDQGDLAKEDRSSVTRKEMDKLIYSESTGIMIGKLAQNFSGNLYAAANHYLNIDDATKKARQEGADTQKAIDNAAASTELGTGGKPKEIEAKTPEEKAAEDNQKRADEIYPDHVYSGS